jgi:hypothetical protein
VTPASLKSAQRQFKKIAPWGIQSNENEIMKIPQIIINPPDWLAVPMASGFGLLFISIIIVLKDLVRLLP